MIMIFELTYDIHHSGIVDYRNKLAIHAKRVTIQPKDMSLLWELWHSIDPVSPIGDPTEQRRIVTRAARIEAARQARGLPAATRLHNRLEASGQRVPARDGPGRSRAGQRRSRAGQGSNLLIPEPGPLFNHVICARPSARPGPRKLWPG